jgi:uncharacterized YigZ family protein
LTLTRSTSGLYRDRGSKFIAYAFPVTSIEAFEKEVEPIRKEHPKARHFCFAYILGPEKELFRYSDDGEPGGSAGLPIYNQLRSFELNYSAVVVVRYFGGKKLGVPGLIQAYKSSTLDAIQNNDIVRKYITDVYKIGYQYDMTGPVMRALNETELTIEENGFEKSPFVQVKIRKSLSEKLKIKLLALILKREETDITGEEELDGFYIELI